MQKFADQHCFVVQKKALHTWELCGRRHGEGVEMGSCDMMQLNRPQGAYPVYMLRCVPAGFSPAGEGQSPAPGEEQPQAPAYAGAIGLESSWRSWSTPSWP